MDIQLALISAVKCLIRVFSDINRIGLNIRTVYRIRIGPDYSKKILDWIRIPKISDLFNTSILPKNCHFVMKNQYCQKYCHFQKFLAKNLTNTCHVFCQPSGSPGSLSGLPVGYPARYSSEFATGYGYPKTAFKREPNSDKDTRTAFLDISRVQSLGKCCTLHNLSFSIFGSIFSDFCAMTLSLSLE